MGIQSTVNYERSLAIDRIKTIYSLVQDSNYKEIEKNTGENPDSLLLMNFVNEKKDSINIDNLENYTNKMLEDIMDQPFFRSSPFDNYIVIDDK